MPWGTIVTIALKVLGWFFAKDIADAETKKKFLELANMMQERGLVSAKIRVEVDDRLANLDAMENEDEGNEG